jgi:hypothetical protein
VSSVIVHTKDEEGVVLHLIGGFVAEVVVPPEAVALGVDRGEVAFGVGPKRNVIKNYPIKSLCWKKSIKYTASSERTLM